jgi:MFS family permease
VLLSATVAHACQDGMVAVQFVLLPLLSLSLGLTYTQVGVLKATSSLAMSCLEIPSGMIARRFGERRLLIVGLSGAALGYAGLTFATTFFAALLFVLIAGCGAAFQHALSSSLLVRHFESGTRRKALGTYNASGDVGKLLYTGLFSVMVGAGFAWNSVVMLMAIAALAAAAVVYTLLQRVDAPLEEKHTSAGEGGWGIQHKGRFSGVLTTVFLDSFVQAGFFTFIALILIDKGVNAGAASFGVVLTLAGGACGKFAGGYLAAGMGDRIAFLFIQLLTVAGLLCVIYFPADTLMFTLPLIGLFVQGSSTISYGAVADCCDADQSARAYSLVYTMASVGSVIGPLTLGVVADRIHLNALVIMLMMVTLLSLTVLSTLSGRRKKSTLIQPR